MNVICTIDMDNSQENYARCLDFIKAVEQKRVPGFIEDKAKDLSIQIGFKYANFAPRFLEEPMQVSERGSEKNSSLQDCHSFSGRDSRLLLSNNNTIGYHLRIHSSGQSGSGFEGGLITNLHYLAMLLKAAEPYLTENGGKIDKRISVFLVPVSGAIYPFTDNNGIIDYDTYKVASQYLRLLSKQYTGVIYGVKKVDDNKSVVTSLEFRRGTLNRTYFPLLLIDDKNYDCLFSPIKQESFDRIFALKKRERLGKSADENPYVAMEDYLAETDVKHIRDNSDNQDAMMSVWQKIVEEVPIWQLHCNQSSEAVEAAYQGMNEMVRKDGIMG